MRFVQLTDYVPNGTEKVDVNNLKSLSIGDTKTYKLDIAKNLIWCSPERNDEFYSEWETVQPAPQKNVVFYEAKSTSYVVRPKDLFEIRKEVKDATKQKDGTQVKEIILDYVRKKQNRKDIESVICEVDKSQDIADLHTLFDTADVEEVVSGYAKSFDAVYWNFIDEKDESGFQVPSLMIMDSKCMNITNTIKTVPYSARKLGVDKISGNLKKDINSEEIVKLLNSDLDLNNAVDLLKLRRDIPDQNLRDMIESKLVGFPKLGDANAIMKQDELANELYIISSDSEKQLFKNRILESKGLQYALGKDRLQHNGKVNGYMAVYVELIEEDNRSKYVKEKREIRKENNLSIRDISKVPGIQDTKRTSIKEWFKNSFSKFKQNKREK